MNYLIAFLGVSGILGIIFLTVPWLVYFLTRLFNPLKYWEWCCRKQNELDAKRNRRASGKKLVEALIAKHIHEVDHDESV